MSQTQSTYQRMTTTTMRRRQWPKEREHQSGDLMEQELRGKHAISMETVTLVARIKVNFSSIGSQACKLRWDDKGSDFDGLNFGSVT